MIKKNGYWLVAASLVLMCVAVAGQGSKSGGDFDVQHYQIDADLIPESQLLRARAEVRFVPLTESRSAVFELNGSLTVKRVTVKTGAAPEPARAPVKAASKTAGATETAGQAGGLQFVQDAKENMNVRVDLGTVYPKGQPVTLVFEYEGALESAQGGPIQNARLAFVGDQGSYLFYAARWFPFHEYAADRATYVFNLSVPKGVTVAGYSEQPVNPVAKADGQTFSFVSTKPLLPGNFAAAKYIVKNFSSGGLSVDCYVKVGDEKWADHAAENISKHLEFYSSKFGRYAFGNRLVVAETDDETLETYSGAGAMFVSPKALASGHDELIAREVAYQWWGQAVGIKSFDDAWISQGLSEFSALLYQKDTGTALGFEQAIRAELERGLAFEQSASIRNAPKQLDDQTPPYRSVIFYKGALVFNMLRQLLGDEKFDKLLKDYFTTYQGRNVSLDEFEAFASKEAGRSLRFFFGQWVDSTGVPEFHADYRMMRNKEGFRVPGTVKQELDTFEMPVEIMLKTEAGVERQTLLMKGTSADFDISTKSKPVEIIVDPDSKLLRSSEELRQGVIVRRGIEHFHEQEYTEAEQQFQAAIKLNRRLSWAWYNLGLLYLTQRNYQKALDAFDEALNGDLRPDWVEVWSYIYRGNAWDAMDQRERAIAEYNKAVSNGNNYDNAQAVAQGYLAQPFDPRKGRQVAS